MHKKREAQTRTMVDLVQEGTERGFDLNRTTSFFAEENKNEMQGKKKKNKTNKKKKKKNKRKKNKQEPEEKKPRLDSQIINN